VDLSDMSAEKFSSILKDNYMRDLMDECSLYKLPPSYLNEANIPEKDLDSSMKIRFQKSSWKQTSKNGNVISWSLDEFPTSFTTFRAYKEQAEKEFR
jgi:hypothetical protein